MSIFRITSKLEAKLYVRGLELLWLVPRGTASQRNSIHRFRYKRNSYTQRDINLNLTYAVLTAALEAALRIVLRLSVR